VLAASMRYVVDAFGELLGPGASWRNWARVVGPGILRLTADSLRGMRRWLRMIFRPSTDRTSSFIVAMDFMPLR